MLSDHSSLFLLDDRLFFSLDFLGGVDSLLNFGLVDAFHLAFLGGGLPGSASLPVRRLKLRRAGVGGCSTSAFAVNETRDMVADGFGGAPWER